MDFRARLKEEIDYSGLQYKELAERAGIKVRALFSYTVANPSMPPADVAARLAKALGVTVEYLVTGEKAGLVIPPRARTLLANFAKLSPTEQLAVERLIETLLQQ